MKAILSFFPGRRIFQPANIEVKSSPLHGLGVFARKRIGKGMLIEKAPVVFLPEEARQTLQHTKLFNYYFLLKNAARPAAFGFGFASFYNHSGEANAFYKFSAKRNTLNIYAFRTIHAGGEITINYNGHPRDKSPVYFPESTAHE